MVIQVQRIQKSIRDAETSANPSPIEGSKPAPFRMVLRRPVMSGYSFIPAIDMYTRNDAMVLRMDLPGIKKDEVEVLATENRLTVSGMRKPAFGINKDDYRINEVSYGNFSRTFNLPVNIDSGKIEANLQDGILEITLPKMAKDKVITVAVKTG
jgi:HSP20 family protein